MAKSTRTYVCQSCGGVSSKWAGKCDACGEWNAMSEEVAEASAPKGLGGGKKGKTLPLTGLRSETAKKHPRHISGINEYDRVTGGGMVPGSAILIGGDPGIGKSTLLLQVMCALALKSARCVYISGEEAPDQVRLRAERLGLSGSPVALAAATSVRDIVASMEDTGDKIDVLVIDSIQTMYVDTVESAPGTVTQVRASAQEIIRSAKRHNITVLFVGHVTKDGQIAGPRVLEHMVDAVLYFEGDRSHQFRILRAVKNRFGPTDEIGVFEMAGAGLMPVENPSALFLAQRQQNVPGSAVLAGLEGTRPVLVEVQALVAPCPHGGSPRRAVIGWDSGRLAMVLAVLEARCGVALAGSDIFLNIAGGIRINEPAADLAVAAALVSAVNGEAIPNGAVFFGEIGLGGEVRQVPQPDIRMKEAARLGFDRAILPARKKDKDRKSANELIEFKKSSNYRILSICSPPIQQRRGSGLNFDKTAIFPRTARCYAGRAMIFDAVVIFALIFSAVIAFLRGFIREVLTIIGLAAGAVAAYFLGPQMVPYTTHALGEKASHDYKLFGMIHGDVLAQVVSYGAVFFPVLIALSIVSWFLYTGAKAMGLGPLDRTMGVVFGLARAMAMLGLLWLPFYTFTEKADRDKWSWLEGSHTRVYVEAVSSWMVTVVPDQMLAGIKKDALHAADEAKSARQTLQDIDVLRKDASKNTLSPPPDRSQGGEGGSMPEPAPAAPPTTGPGYGNQQRNDLGNLINKDMNSGKNP